MKKFVLTIIFFGSAAMGYSQAIPGLWRAAHAIQFAGDMAPFLRPEQFSAFTADESTLAGYLAKSPDKPEAATVFDLPTPEGGYQKFRVWSTPCMEAPLAGKYPEIRTYTAVAVTNHQITAKLDYGPFGFHAIVFNGSGSWLIDPCSASADGRYVAYYKRDYNRRGEARPYCGFPDEEGLKMSAIGPVKNDAPKMEALVNGLLRKVYRLALAADSEYCAAVAGPSPSKADVLAKMVTSLNRINGIYERELALSMVLVANNDTLIFINGSPYTNNSGSAMMLQNQTIVDLRIGDANYDIGHVFSTGGGGIAQRAKVCQSGSKAQGVTGLPSPVGDAFDVDFVAHEIGHQFGGNHTFNANTGSCNNNGVASSAFEPGAGTTIMAYAGFCGSGNDYQPHSDAYFHSASLEQISAYITAPGLGSTCPATFTSSNTKASMPPFVADYAIPYNTPFELTAPRANDLTADTLNYCWEQRDLGDFTSDLQHTHFAGPLFRSFSPDTSRTRTFPAITHLVRNTSPIGEKLPDTARRMSFGVTERGIFQGWGCFNFPDDRVVLDVINTGAPFTVSLPGSGAAWTGGQKGTIMWNVVGSHVAPINARNVDIYLSLDSGYTFPILLKRNTPNDGQESIVVPNIASTDQARIKVKGHDNVFFNLSPGVFTIHHSAIAEHVHVMPVPAWDKLVVYIPDSMGDMSARIMNELGQTVWNGHVRGYSEIDVRHWARGRYYLCLRGTDGARIIEKLQLN